jgi:DNA-binding MarR family transcriptional regulator
METKITDNGWYIFSSHGIVLFHIAAHPGCSVAEIADDLCLTQRTVWGAIGALRRANMLTVERKGRRHFYRVNMDAQFRAPAVKDVKLATLFGELPNMPRNGAMNGNLYARVS